MATLKISDLSVGDWVRYRGLDYQVKEIDGLLNRVRLVGNKEQRVENTNSIHPIPITAEILEKNGWEFYRNSLWWTTQINTYTRVNVWLGNNGECRVEVSCMTKELDYYFCYADVKLPNAHIHLLQRALRLAGVDKEINL
jgi:hypothetical protein